MVTHQQLWMLLRLCTFVGIILHSLAFPADNHKSVKVIPRNVNGTTNKVRPVYNCAHMVNSISEVQEYLNLGANAIETDVNFDKTSGVPTIVFHGWPCDLGRHCSKKEDFLKHIKYLAQVATPGHTHYNPGFTGLVWLDLKLTGVALGLAGKQLATILANQVFNKKTNLKLMMEITEERHWKFVKEFVATCKKTRHPEILQKTGVGVTGPALFDTALVKAKALGIPLWLGDGRPNVLHPLMPKAGLRKAVKLRDLGQSSQPAKVFDWTVDFETAMRFDLSLGIDVILTNEPQAVYKLIKEPEYRGKTRLATTKDDPFIAVKGHGPYRVGCSVPHSSLELGKSHPYKCWKEVNLDGDYCWTKMNCKIHPSVCQYNSPCASTIIKRAKLLQQHKQPYKQEQ